MHLVAFHHCLKRDLCFLSTFVILRWMIFTSGLLSFHLARKYEQQQGQTDSVQLSMEWEQLGTHPSSVRANTPRPLPTDRKGLEWLLWSEIVRKPLLLSWFLMFGPLKVKSLILLMSLLPLLLSMPKVQLDGQRQKGTVGSYSFAVWCTVVKTYRTAADVTEIHVICLDNKSMKSYLHIEQNLYIIYFG